VMALGLYVSQAVSSSKELSVATEI
jgi:hypothetical protein